ncbi:MAG: T9SS type A sorting domain-containing protein [Balneolaceae bacterium]
MGKLLQHATGFFNFSFLFLLIVAVDTSGLSAQVTFENLLPFELEISNSTDLSDVNYWRLSPADSGFGSLFGTGFLQSAGMSDGGEEGHFLLYRPEGPYLALRPGNRTDRPLVRFSIYNETGKTVDQVQIALNMAFQVSGGNEGELGISYNSGSVSRGRSLLNTGQFEPAPENWQTTSLNTIVENLFMEQGDSIEVLLSFEGDEGETVMDAAAINGLRLTPGEFIPPDTFSVGDLSVTEILPGSAVGGKEVSFFEIYNTTYDSVDLRGLKVRAGEDEFIIREPLVIDPYEMAVIANTGMEESSLVPDLILERMYLESDGGMIELIQGEERILRSAYDEHPGNRSWELKNVLHAMDGYSSLGDYELSDEIWSSGVYASPGTRGHTSRIFTREQAESGNWQMLSAPGRLLTNKAVNVSYWTDSRERETNRETKETSETGNVRLPAGAGILTDRTAVQDAGRWIAEESDAGSEVWLDLLDAENSWILLGNPFNVPIPMKQIQAADGDFYSRTGQVWDNRMQTFKILNPDNLLQPWQAVVVRNRDAGAVRFEPAADIGNTPPASDRSITFNLQVSDNRRSLTDHAAVLYFHDEANHDNDILDVEKLWPVFSGGEAESASVLYFIGQNESGASLLAQDARPFEPENGFEVMMGYGDYNISGEHTLLWDEMNNIPDYWEVELTDLETGLTVDMREEFQMTFEALPGHRITPEFSESTPFQAVQPAESNERFRLTIDPDPHSSAARQAGQSLSGDVQLHQNYPNPFRSLTNIEFFLPEESSVVVSVYNIVGQRVAQLLNGTLPEGESPEDLVWDASEMPSGIYILRLEIGNRVFTRKMTLIK